LSKPTSVKKLEVLMSGNDTKQDGTVKIKF
jgi:hypothetical protein